MGLGKQRGLGGKRWWAWGLVGWALALGIALWPLASWSNPNPLSPSSTDPADQVAPPGLRVEPGNGPIVTFLSVTMQQELLSLMGRFESAFLATASQELEPFPGVTLPTTRAGNGDRRSDQQPAMGIARALLRDWPRLMGQEAFGEIRDRWLAARQALWRDFPQGRPFAPPEIRAVWLDRGTLVEAGSAEGLAEVFDRLALAGINTVFVETLNAGYPIYPSAIAPQQNPLIQGWDPLATAVDLGHERAMAVHAWIWVFATGNQMHNRILNQPQSFLGPVLTAHPTWAGRDNRNRVIPPDQTKPFLDPANPDVRAYLLALEEEIITQYPVDGLQLDYIRYPFQDPGANRTYGYGQAARQQFRALTGLDPLNLSPRPTARTAAARAQQIEHWQQWTDFRIQQVTQFVEESAQLVRQRRPEIVLSTAVFALPTGERLQKIQQDWEDWARRGIVDWVVLMSYAQDSRALRSLIQPWVVTATYDRTLILPSIRLLNLSDAAVLDQLQSIRDLSTVGHALFAAANFQGTLPTMLQRTQGNPIQRHPQTHPFVTAQTRYRALQQEWQWLLNHGQLLIDRSNPQQWVQAVNELGNGLNTLARQPSASGAMAARSRLSNLRRSLDLAITLQVGSPDYRLEAWRQRINTLDRLLNYGAQLLTLSPGEERPSQARGPWDPSG